jgi:hypothetical protein
LQGNLNNQIARLETNAPRPGSQGFLQPDAAALDDFSRLTEEILANRLQAAAEIAAQYDYELVRYIDRGAQDAETIVLRELKPFRRAWGLYIFRPEACTPGTNTIIVEAPHTLADEGTPQIALDTFRALQACALLVAGAHRDANQDGSADVAHNPQTVFQAIHEALANAAGQSGLILQIHGFAAGKHPGYPAVVLGGSPPDDPNLSTLLVNISQALTADSISVGLCNGVNWTALCGETNVQAANLPAGLFIHLELGETMRTAPAVLVSSLVGAIKPKPEGNRPATSGG